MDKQEAIKLLERYELGQCTSAEIALLEQWYLKETALQEMPATKPNYSAVKKEIWNSLNKPKVPYMSNSWIAIASAIAIISLLTVYLYTKSRHANLNLIAIEKAKSILPGTNKAVLTLADGSKISLTDAQNGELAQQAGAKVSKTANGLLVYTADHTHPSKVTTNTVETPAGGQYQIILPDGTKVWLNASTSLKYPASFGATGDRRVELTGEAYFEVAKDKVHPFKVKTATQEVEVLGTHFNINSYANEGKTVTTLQEGRVQVATASTKHILSPGQKVVNTAGGQTEVLKADLETELAWKNGWMEFKNADVQTIMRQISRWYNIEVVFTGPTGNRTFTGGVARSSNLTAVLELLRKSNINFSIEESPKGKKLIIKP